MEYYITATKIGELKLASEVNISQTKKKQKEKAGLTQAQKFRKALKLSQSLASVASEGGMKVFTQRMAQLEQLLSLWMSGKSAEVNEKAQTIIKSKDIKTKDLLTEQGNISPACGHTAHQHVKTVQHTKAKGDLLAKGKTHMAQDHAVHKKNAKDVHAVEEKKSMAQDHCTYHQENTVHHNANDVPIVGGKTPMAQKYTAHQLKMQQCDNQLGECRSVSAN